MGAESQNCKEEKEMAKRAGILSVTRRRMESKLLNDEEVGIREVQKLGSRSRRPSGPHCNRWLAERNSRQAWRLWMVSGAVGS